MKVPTTRKVAKEFMSLPLDEIECLLHSEIHEERLLALVILVGQFENGDDATRKLILRLLPRQHSPHQQLGLGGPVGPADRRRLLGEQEP